MPYVAVEGTDLDDSFDTVPYQRRFIDDVRPTTVTYGITTPYPGTPLYDQVVAEHPELGDGSLIDVRTIHTNGTFNRFYTSLEPEELQDWVRKAYKRFYFRPSYVLGWLPRVRSIAELSRLSLAGATVFDFVRNGD